MALFTYHSIVNNNNITILNCNDQISSVYTIFRQGEHNIAKDVRRLSRAIGGGLKLKQEW